MSKSFDSLFSLPERLYRSPEEIRKDMSQISDGLLRIDSMLSVHNLRASLVGECTVDELRRKIPELHLAVAEADKSLRLIVRFSRAVAELRRELDEVRCVLSE